MAGSDVHFFRGPCWGVNLLESAGDFHPEVENGEGEEMFQFLVPTYYLFIAQIVGNRTDYDT